MRRLLMIPALLSCEMALANNYTTPYGEWRGQTEYQAVIKSMPDPKSHLVTNLTINIEPGGKVTGTSTENNCRLLGLAIPGSAPYIVTLKVTVTGCNYEGLNRQYQGTFSVNAKGSFASFNLLAIAINQPVGSSGTFSITSTMRR